MSRCPRGDTLHTHTPPRLCLTATVQKVKPLQSVVSEPSA
jgi:hypothetical protein